MTEMSEDCRKVAGGTCKNKDRERQASVATKGYITSRESFVMEEVVCYENLMLAVQQTGTCVPHY